MATEPADTPDGVPHDIDPTLGGSYESGVTIADKFQLLRPLGSGGMGTVWVAHNRLLDIQVAVKLIDLEGLEDRRAAGKRLLAEARSAARLGHPAVVKILDFGFTGPGDPFIAMELLDGEDLADVLEREGQVDAITALETMLPLAHGLAAAHDKGIVHRDIKPENLFLARNDDGSVEPKILDFGIARLIDSPTRLTIEGTRLGTPEYVSPELARGESSAGPATDIWSFCVVLYELVSGACPFRGINYNVLMQSIIHEPPRPLEDYGVFDHALWSIIERGLAKRPEDRWPSMRDLGAAMAGLLIERGVEEDVSGRLLGRTWNIPTASRAADAGPPSSGERSRNDPKSEESHLAAIADLNRGGDPAKLLARAEQRRLAVLISMMVVLLLGLVASILTSTGVF